MTGSPVRQDGDPLSGPERAVPGTRGYAERATELLARYESVPFPDKHPNELGYLPTTPAKALDVGAGSGADAAWLAAQGYSVLAVEPTEAFRTAAQRLHPSPAIEWLDDSLPSLSRVLARNESWDLVLLSAVWMHLRADERPTAMTVLSSLLSGRGTILLSLRHGPIPEMRHMFDVSGEETVAHAERSGLRCLHMERAESSLQLNRDAGITWTRIVLGRGLPAPGFRQAAT